jgi:hypothetical protein
MGCDTAQTGKSLPTSRGTYWLGLVYVPADGGRMFLQMTANFCKLHSAISQKKELLE